MGRLDPLLNQPYDPGPVRDFADWAFLLQYPCGFPPRLIPVMGASDGKPDPVRGWQAVLVHLRKSV
jgi:hypothetical protein